MKHVKLLEDFFQEPENKDSDSFIEYNRRLEELKTESIKLIRKFEHLQEELESRFGESDRLIEMSWGFKYLWERFAMDDVRIKKEDFEGL